MNRLGAVNWKALVILLLVGGAIAFGVRQFNTGWRERPPAEYAFKRRSSPSLDSDARTRLGALVKEARRRASSEYLPVASLEFLQLSRDGKADVFWRSDQLKNGGFEPLANFERGLHIPEKKLIGYYTLDGEPVAFTVKHDPKHPDRLSVTIHVSPPVTKGALQVILRAERREDEAHRADDGNLIVTMRDQNRNEVGLHARGVQLPPGAVIVTTVPDDVPTLIGGATPLLGWFCSDVEMKLPLAVTFRL